MVRSRACQLPAGAGGPRLRLAQAVRPLGHGARAFGGQSRPSRPHHDRPAAQTAVRRAPRRAHEDARTAAYPGACGYGKRGRQARRGSARRFSGRSAEGSGPHHRGRLPRGARAVQHPFRTAARGRAVQPPEAPCFRQNARRAGFHLAGRAGKTLRPPSGGGRAP